MATLSGTLQTTKIESDNTVVKPLKQAIIMLKAENKEHKVTTDDNGKYKLAVPNGTYTVYLGAVGHSLIDLSQEIVITNATKANALDELINNPTAENVDSSLLARFKELATQTKSDADRAEAVQKTINSSKFAQTVFSFAREGGDYNINSHARILNILNENGANAGTVIESFNQSERTVTGLPADISDKYIVLTSTLSASARVLYQTLESWAGNRLRTFKRAINTTASNTENAHTAWREVTTTETTVGGIRLANMRVGEVKGVNPKVGEVLVRVTDKDIPVFRTLQYRINGKWVNAVYA